MAWAAAVMSAILAAPTIAMGETPAGSPEANPDKRLTLSLGASTWSGDFGAPANSQISAVLSTVTYRDGGLRLSASLPWMRIDSSGAIFTGIDGAPLVVSPGADMSAGPREGVGDLTIGAAYLLPTSDLDIDLYARVKAPTGSRARGVSTGKADFAVGAEASKRMGALTPSVAVRYRAFGDAGDWRLKNGFAASVGAAYQLPRDVVLLVSYDFAQAASDFIDYSHELVAGASAPLGDSGLRLTGFVSGGLSKGASDVSGGLSLAKTF